MKIRYNLKYSIKKQDRLRLPPAVDDFKTAKLPDDDGDLPKADRVMKLFQAADGRTYYIWDSTTVGYFSKWGQYSIDLTRVHCIRKQCRIFWDGTLLLGFFAA